MSDKSIKVFVRVLLLGLLLGASSTAYADAFSLTSFTVTNRLCPKSLFVAASPP